MPKATTSEVQLKDRNQLGKATSLILPDNLPLLPLMMTAGEIADTLQISVRTVWRLKSTGSLPESVNIGRAVRWKRTDILEWIQRGCQARDPVAFDRAFIAT